MATLDDDEFTIMFGKILDLNLYKEKFTIRSTDNEIFNLIGKKCPCVCTLTRMQFAKLGKDMELTNDVLDFFDKNDKNEEVGE